MRSALGDQRGRVAGAALGEKTTGKSIPETFFTTSTTSLTE